MLVSGPDNAYFDSGSFLFFEGDVRFDFPFERDLQLRFLSSQSALTSLLTFLDEHYPGPAFSLSNAKRCKKIASQWLGKPWNAGRIYCSEDHRHLEDSEENEGCELTWPDDTNDLVYGIKELLKELKPRAKEFYEARSKHFEEMAKLKEEKEKKENKKDDEDENEDEDEDEDERPRKKQKTSAEQGLTIRRKA